MVSPKREKSLSGKTVLRTFMEVCACEQLLRPVETTEYRADADLTHFAGMVLA